MAALNAMTSSSVEKPAEEGPANASKEVRVTFRSHLTGRPGRLQPATPASENL